MFVVLVSIILILSIYISGNYAINENKNFLKTINEKINVKIISPNFELEYGVNIYQIENKLKKLIRYSDPQNNKKTIFIWPEGIFSGYSFEEISILELLHKILFARIVIFHQFHLTNLEVENQYN